MSQILESSSATVLSSIPRRAETELKKSNDPDVNLSSLAIDQSEVLPAPRVTATNKEESNGTHKLFETSIKSYEGLQVKIEEPEAPVRQLTEDPMLNNLHSRLLNEDLVDEEDFMQDTVTSNIDMRQFELGSLEDVDSPRDFYKDPEIIPGEEEDDEILKKTSKDFIQNVSLLRSNNLDMFGELSGD